MEIVKEFFGTVDSRLRSHFFGSILLSFLAFNWKSIAFLFYADADLKVRFSYVDENAWLWTPLIVGTVIAVIAPWLTFLGGVVASAPTSQLRSLQDKAASDRTIEKIDLEAAENDARAKVAKAVDSTLGSLDDEDVRDKFRSDALSETKDSVADANDAMVIQYELSPNEEYILKRIIKSEPNFITINENFGKQEIEINGQPVKAKPFIEYENAIQSLMQKRIIESLLDQSTTTKIYRPTKLGTSLAKKLMGGGGGWGG